MYFSQLNVLYVTSMKFTYYYIVIKTKVLGCLSIIFDFLFEKLWCLLYFACIWLFHLLLRVIAFLLKIYVLVDIEHHSWLECHETHFEHKMVIFGKFSFKINVFFDKKSKTKTIVSNLKSLKVNRTPAIFIHQFSSWNNSPKEGQWPT